MFSFLLQAFLFWWARTGYPEELPTEEAIASGMRQLGAAALAARWRTDFSWVFVVHDAVAAYAVPDGEKQALREKLWAESVAPPCEDPAVKHVMEVMREIWAELEDDGTWRGNTAHPGIGSLKELVPCLAAQRHWCDLNVLAILFMGAVLISLSPSAAKAYVDVQSMCARLGRHFNAHRQRATLWWAVDYVDQDLKYPGYEHMLQESASRKVARALLPEEHIVRRVLEHPDRRFWMESYWKVRAQATSVQKYDALPVTTSVCECCAACSHLRLCHWIDPASSCQK